MGYDIILGLLRFLLPLLARFGGYLACLALAGWIYHQGQVHERTRQELAAAIAAQATLERQRSIAEEALGKAQADAIVRNGRSMELENQVRDYEQQLAAEAAARAELVRKQDESMAQFEERLRLAQKHKPTAKGPSRNCTLTDADVRSLLNIR